MGSEKKGGNLNFFFLGYFLIETPEPPKSCELRNDTILEVVCVAGFDGGLTQHFLLEVVGGNPIYTSSDTTKSIPEIIDNEISTMNDQVRVLKEYSYMYYIYMTQTHFFTLRVYYVLVFMCVEYEIRCCLLLYGIVFRPSY